MFTDGSYTCDQRLTDQLFLGNTSLIMHPWASIGEVEAIRKAQQLNCTCDRLDNAVLFIDSKPAILAISNLSNKQSNVKSLEIIKCQKLHSQLKLLTSIYSLGNCGIEGNENADLLS